ncbi:MAG: hypothetical protein AAGH83_10965 [Pseudomonadota bacterium]
MRSAPARLVSVAALAAALASGAWAQDSAAEGAAARAVVEQYYADLDAGDYAKAYALWGNDGVDSGQSFDAFKAGYAETAHVEVFTQAATDPEGAAGSLFITVPVRIEARLTSGDHQRFGGSYTLRRVDDVPGATEAQLHWHLSSSDIHQIE